MNKLLAATILSGALTVLPGHVEARSCSVTNTQYTTSAFCYDSDENYRRCGSTNFYRTICGPWRDGRYGETSTASIPLANRPAEYFISRWTQWTLR